MPKHNSTSTFQDKWLHKCSPYSGWIKKGHVKTEAFCNWCARNVKLSSMGEAALRSHVKSDAHKRFQNEQFKNKETIFDKCKSNSRQTCNIVEVTENVSQSETSSDIESVPVNTDRESVPVNTDRESIRPVNFNKYIISDSTTEAEILWCLDCVMSHSSLRMAGSKTSLFRRMFHDSHIANQFSLSKDKVRYMINFGIAPYFHEKLVKVIFSCQYYVVLFDESLNKIAQKGQMDIHVRYFDGAKVLTRYLTSVFLGRAKAENLLESFQKGIQEINQAKIHQVSMDGPNVNHKFIKLYQKYRSENNFLQLLECGTCSLHVVCGSLKTADTAVGWHVGDFLSAAYYLFNKSPMRRALYLETTNSNDPCFPLKFCSTRWVENAQCAARVLSLMPKLKKFVSKVSGSKDEPNISSYNKVQKALQSNIISARIAFFQHVSEILEKFLTLYQTDAPMVPFLYNDLIFLMRNLLSKIIKKHHLEGKSGKELASLKLSANSILMHPSEIDLGFAVAEEIKKIREHLSNTDILQFRKECLQFIIKIVNKIQEKCPLKFKVVRGAGFLDPNIMKSYENIELLDLALEEFISVGLMTATDADSIKLSYTEVCKLAADEISKYSREMRLDKFWLDAIAKYKLSSSFKDFIFRILTLSHGQASVERGFSINKEMIVENQNESSLIAMRTVYDEIQSNGMPIQNLDIPKALTISARSSRNRYHNFLEEERKKLAASEQTSINERKRKLDTIKEKEESLRFLKEERMKEEEKLNEDIKKLKKNL